jgi:MFS family permease
LAFGLAPEDAQGQYQGAFIMGSEQVGGMVGPLLLTTLAVGWGAAGWVVLGTMIAICGLTIPLIVRWAHPRLLDGQCAVSETSR